MNCCRLGHWTSAAIMDRTVKMGAEIKKKNLTALSWFCQVFGYSNKKINYHIDLGDKQMLCDDLAQG